MTEILSALPPITAESVDPRVFTDPDKYKSVVAEILYVHADSPLVINNFFWHTVDIWPKLPRLHEFRDGWLQSNSKLERGWQEPIEGTLVGIRAKVAPLTGVLTGELRYFEMMYTIPRERFIVGNMDDRRQVNELKTTGKALGGPTGLILLH